MKKVYIVGSAPDSYIKWTGLERTFNEKDADIIFFTGGADVNPELYGEKIGIHTGIDKYRDEKEMQHFFKALKNGKQMIGICRGLK